MARPAISRRRRARLAGDFARRLGSEFRAIREDAGISQSELGRRAAVDQAAISRLEAGRAVPGVGGLVALSDALGARLTLRLYPGTGPRLRDAHQAALVEALLGRLHPSWRAVVEVPVYAPTRGVIDVVLLDRLHPFVVAVEVHSQIRRLEQQLRWAAQKADALPSSRLWSELPAGVTVSRLLVLRSTRATRSVVRSYRATCAAAYPADSRDAIRALAAGDPWPGPAIVWGSLDDGRAWILDRAPRGLSRARPVRP